MSVFDNFPYVGHTTTISTLAGQHVDVSYAVAEVEDLVISNRLDGSINGDYPQELQPRDRTSLESKLQVNRIAHNLQPEGMAESETSANGAPIVGSDRIVESGNGRTLGLWRAYASDQAEEYRNWLLSNASAYGLQADAVAELGKPVLVRIRLTDVDRAQFAKDSNTQNSVPDKPFFEKVMPGNLPIDKKALKNASQLLNSCSNLEQVISLLQALALAGAPERDGFAYRLGVTIKNATDTLKRTTPENTAALTSYQGLVKRLLGSGPDDVIAKLDHQSRRDFYEILGINTYQTKASDWRMRFSNGELWQLGGLLKQFAAAAEDERPDLARQMTSLMTKYCGRGRTFDMTYLGVLRQLIPAEMSGKRPGEVHNMVMIYSKQFGSKALSAEDADKRMVENSAAGRAELEKLAIIERARAARDAIRTEAQELSAMMQGALDQSEIRNALDWSPALKGMTNYDPAKDKVFGARYSPLSHLLRSMEYASTQATIERISRINPAVAQRITDFYANYQVARDDISGAFKAHIDGVIERSQISDAQADEWLKTIDISKSAIRDFDARWGKGSIQGELKKIYRLTNGNLKSLRKISFKKNARAYASVSTGEVVLASTNDLSVLWHEVGHHFEFSNPDRLEKAKAFLRKRMGPKEGYMLIEGTNDEAAINDSLSESYIGRVYGNKTLSGTDATEVYSMAFQCILDKRYCANSVINNDELLDFLLGEISEVQNA